ncbi:UNVERIFIED_CONTAM: hypothetical protein RMT77_002232 [Armadillidium vulgare]
MEEIKIDKKDGMIYFPPCFKVKKCSGYCFGMRKCRPTEIQSQTHHILEIKATSYSGITYKDVMTSPFIKTVVENHKKCQCDCAVLEHECRYPHQYNKMDCTCECSNKEDEQKCLYKSKTHRWNENRCACECKYFRRMMEECSTGKILDETDCTCVHKADHAWASEVAHNNISN